MMSAVPFQAMSFENTYDITLVFSCSQSMRQFVMNCGFTLVIQGFYMMYMAVYDRLNC